LKRFEDSLEDALKYAFRLLGHRDRSEKEMYEKLSLRGFSEKAAEGAVVYLRDRGFLNDMRFAEILKKDAIERKHLGRRAVKSYLMNKGISDDIANVILGDDDDYFDAAKNLIEKKLRNAKAYDENTKRRLWGMLSRRGFSYNTINRALKFYGAKEE
jgi:regulatory protein